MPLRLRSAKSARLHRTLLLVSTFIATPALIHAALTDRVWQGAASANWNTAGNWSGGLPDTNTERAVINAAGTPVILNTNPNTGGLDIASGFKLTRADADTTSRSITLNAATPAETYFNNAGTISSGGTSGTLTLNIYQSATTVINSGFIEATAGTELVLRPSSTGNLSLINTGGTLRTVGNGTLTLGLSNLGAINITGGNLQNTAGTINQSKAATFTDVTVTNGGTYTVEAPAATGNPWGTTLSGASTFTNSGTLNILRTFDSASAATQSTTFNISGSSTTALTNSSTGIININAIGDPLSGTTYSAALNFNANSTITNNGTINLISQSATNTARILVSTGFTGTFSGTGELVMQVGAGGDVSKVILLGTATSTLINSTGHTIRGVGLIGNNALGTLTNAGTINADNATSALTINFTGTGTTGIFTNSGTLRASGAAGMVIVDGALTNTGTVRVDSGSTLTIQSGSFTSTAGTIRADGTLANTPDLLVSSGTITGQGSISGNVNISGPVTFTPGGTSTHVLAFGNNLAFNAAGSSRTISFNFDHFDSRIDVGGALTQGLNNLFEFNFGNSAAYEVDTVYTLISVTGSNSLNDATFSISSSSLSAGYVLDTTFGGGDGWQVSGGNLQVRFASIATGIIPEPSQTLLSVIAGVAGIMFYSRRRKVAA